MTNYALWGDIAILKTEGMTKGKIAKQAKELLKKPNIHTIVEKKGKTKGRLRTIETKHIAGEKKLITLHKESGCLFKIDVENCYFSAGLSNERLEVAKLIKKKDNVLVMFSGVAPFPIIIAKRSNPKKIVAVELGRICNKMAKENLKLNKLEDKIKLIQGDVKKHIPKLKEKFDIIVMARPRLKETFLKQAFSVSKKGTKIIYYCFCHQENLNYLLEAIKKEAKENKKKIKILRIKPAGNIAPFKYRYRIELKVL